MPRVPVFPPASLKFLQQIRRHNNREWFERNRHIYEDSLKRPMQELLAVLAQELHDTAREMVIDPKRSIFRIHRDIRFSADKSPYKTQIAAAFPVRGISGYSGPCLYFHYSADEVLIGGGVYAPDASSVRAIREHVARHHRRLAKILADKRFCALLGELEGEQLKKLPRGFAPDQPAEKYLRYKQFLFLRKYPSELALTPKLLPQLLKCFGAGMPLIRYLAEPFKKLKADSAAFASDKPRLSP